MESLASRLSRPDRKPWPSSPVPIALVITDLDRGGAERALCSLAKGLDREAFAPTVVCLGTEGELASELRSAGLPVANLNANPRKPVRGVAALARALRDFKPLLVQSFLFHANVAARIAANFAGKPWVLGGTRVAERGKPWHLLLEKLSAGLCCGSVCVSEGVWRFMRFEGRWPSERLTVIPNGIEPSAYDQAIPLDRTELGVGEDCFLLLFVGRLDLQKGVHDLLTAFESLARSRDDCRLLIVGAGPLEQELNDRVAGSQFLGEQVVFLGKRGDVPSLLRTADVLVLPSLWEGMPNVVLEAMAAGLAVVSTKIEGSDELVVPGQTGWLSPPGDPESLAKAMIEAASDRDRCKSFGSAGRLRIGEKFSLSRTILAYQSLWAGVLGLEDRWRRFEE